MNNTDKIRKLLRQTLSMMAGGENGYSHQKLYDWVAEALALLPCETCNGATKISKLFDQCPECGCKEIRNENLLGEGFRHCAKCGQEWWTDVKYDTPCPDCQF